MTTEERLRQEYGEVVENAKDVQGTQKIHDTVIMTHYAGLGLRETINAIRDSYKLGYKDGKNGIINQD